MRGIFRSSCADGETAAVPDPERSGPVGDAIGGTKLVTASSAIGPTPARE